MSTYDPIKIVRLYLFGTDTPSTDDYSQHIRPWNVNIGANQAKVPYDMQAYMETGAGRYAYPVLFKAIEKIFTKPITDGEYTFDTRFVDGKLKVGIKDLLGISDNDLKLKISQYGTDSFY